MHVVSNKKIKSCMWLDEIFRDSKTSSTEKYQCPRKHMQGPKFET